MTLVHQQAFKSHLVYDIFVHLPVSHEATFVAPLIFSLDKAWQSSHLLEHRMYFLCLVVSHMIANKAIFLPWNLGMLEDQR